MAALRMSMRAAALRIAKPSMAIRFFQTSRISFAGKETIESDSRRADEIEQTKQQQLKEQKEGKGEWKQELASESESIAKADRGELKADKETIQELQKESAQAAQKERKG